MMTKKREYARSYMRTYSRKARVADTTIIAPPTQSCRALMMKAEYHFGFLA